MEGEIKKKSNLISKRIGCAVNFIVKDNVAYSYVALLEKKLRINSFNPEVIYFEQESKLSFLSQDKLNFKNRTAFSLLIITLSFLFVLRLFAVSNVP